MGSQGIWTPAGAPEGGGEAGLGSSMTVCALQAAAGRQGPWWGQEEAGHRGLWVVRAIVQESDNGSLDLGPHRREPEWRHFGQATDRTC